jgi:outer membrane protein, heavy metal efflux system
LLANNFATFPDKSQCIGCIHISGNIVRYEYTTGKPNAFDRDTTTCFRDRPWTLDIAMFYDSKRTRRGTSAVTSSIRGMLVESVKLPWVTATFAILLALLGGCKSLPIVSGPKTAKARVASHYANESTGQLPIHLVSLRSPVKNEQDAIIRSSELESISSVACQKERTGNANGNIERTNEFQLVALESPLAFETKSPAANLEQDDASQTKSVSVTLNQVIFASLNGHPTISAELENIQKARGDFLTSTLFPNPQLFTDIQLLPLTRPFTETRQGGPPQQDVVLTYPIDWFLFGKRSAAMSSNHFSIHIGQSSYENLVRIRIVEAAVAFYTALEADALLDLASQNVESLTRVEKITEEAVANGGRPAIESSRVRLDVVAAQQRKRTALANKITASAKLRALMGQSDNSLSVQPSGELGGKFTQEILPIESAFTVAQSNRPDVESLRLQLSKSQLDILVQQKAAKPSVAPSFGYTRQYQQAAIGFPDANSWSAALNMGLPISDRNQGNIYKAGAESRRVQFQYESAILGLRAEVEQAVAELTAAEENAKSVENEQIVLANKVLDSIIEAYQNGARPLLDVLDAQRNFRDILGLYITSRAEYWRALYRYQGALGRSTGDR